MTSYQWYRRHGFAYFGSNLEFIHRLKTTRELADRLLTNARADYLANWERPGVAPLHQVGRAETIGRIALR